VTVTHKRSVVIIVTDDERTARRDYVVEGRWPGHVMPDVFEMIEDTARAIARDIREAVEGNENAG
jgi:hypothetical protein